MRDVLGMVFSAVALFACAVLLVSWGGCAAQDATAEWIPMIACEAASASMTDDALPPPPPPAPDSGQAVGAGPLDTLRDAKALVADARAILNQAKRDGEVVVRVQLPKPEAMAKVQTASECRTCPNGRCPSRLAILPEVDPPEPGPTLAPRRSEAADSATRQDRRLGWRLRGVGQRVFCRGGLCGR